MEYSEYESAPNLGNISTNISVNTTPGEADEQPGVPCAGGVFFFIIYGPVWGSVCIFGIIGNTLSYAVLHKYSRSNVANYQLKALAITDNLFLIMSLFVQTYPAMIMSFGLTVHLVPVFPYLQTYAWPVSHMTQMVTVWMMVLVATNRYIAVCHPLHAPRLCSKYKVKVQIALMFIGVVIYNTSRFFEYRFVDFNVTDSENRTVLRQENLGLQRYKLYNILYENVSYCLFLFLIPLVILIVLNTHLVRELKTAQKSRVALTSRSSNEENNITLVMIIIIISFIVCQTPAAINQVLYYLVAENQKQTCSHYQRFYHVSNLLVMTNSAVNFVIYCLFRRQFQQDLCALICGRPRASKTTNSIRYTSSYRTTTATSINKTSSVSTTAESLPLTPNVTKANADKHKENGYEHRFC